MSVGWPKIFIFLFALKNNIIIFYINKMENVLTLKYYYKFINQKRESNLCYRNSYKEFFNYYVNQTKKGEL